MEGSVSMYDLKSVQRLCAAMVETGERKISIGHDLVICCSQQVANVALGQKGFSFSSYIRTKDDVPSDSIT